MKRGYALLEVAIGGAMIALLCATLLSSLADARVHNVAGGRKIIASQLALEKIEQERALGFAGIGSDGSCSAGGVNDTPGNVDGNYTRNCKFLSPFPAPTTFTEFGGVTVNCKRFLVTVTYPSEVARNGTGVESITERSQVCK